MSGTSTVRQLVLLLLLLGYGKQDRSEATSTSGSSDATKRSDASTSSSQNDNSDQRLSKTDGTGLREIVKGDLLLRIRVGRERPFDSSVILPKPSMLRKLNVKKLNKKYFRLRMPLDAHRISYFPNLRIPKHIRKLVRGFMDSAFREYRRSKVKRMTQKLERYFTDYSVCSVHYMWFDLGNRYWPRWARADYCDNGKSHTRLPFCSIPLGKSCLPYHRLNFTVLRYMCPTTWQTKDCGWKLIVYDRILTSCICALRDS